MVGVVCAHSVLAKVDACWRLSKELKEANEALHSEDTEALPATFQLFRDLQARAAKAKSQKEETDVDKLKGLRDSAHVEKNYIDEKVQELNQQKAKIPAEIKTLKEKNRKLDQKLKQLTTSADDSQEAIDQVTVVMGDRRRNRARLSELEAELVSIDEMMGQYKKDATDLADKIETYTSKIEGAPPSAKKSKR